MPVNGGGGTPTNWGDEAAYSLGWNLGNLFAYIGGISPSGASNTLESITFVSSNPEEIRLALYSGGTSSTDPSGATLLEDLGTVSATATGQTITLDSTTNPTLPNASQI